MKKRMTAFLLALSTLIGLLPLSACGGRGAGSGSGSGSVSSSASGLISRGELLALICDEFGMYSFTEQTPYIAAVGVGHPYYEAVQMCAEWEVIDPNQSDYDVDGPASRRDLALAAVNAAVLTDLEASEADKLAAAQVNKVVESGEWDESVTAEEAARAVQTAAELWRNRTYDTPVQKYDLADNVKDMTAAPVRVEYDTSRLGGGSSDSGEGAWSPSITDAPATVYLPVSAGEIKPGDMFVYSSPYGMTAAKADQVREENGYYVILESAEELDYEEFVKDIEVQETYAPDLLSGTFVDGAGNVYNFSEGGGAAPMSQTGGAPVLVPLKHSSTSNAEARQLDNKMKGSISFKVKDIEIEGEITSSSIKIGLKKDHGNGELSGGVEISDLNVTTDIHGLRSGLCKLDYKCTFEGGYSETMVDKITAPYNNGNGHFLSNLRRSTFHDAEEKGADYIKIGSWDLFNAGVAQLKLECRLQFTVKGEISVQVVIAGAKGIEYRKGNVRLIKEKSMDADLTVKCNATLTGNLGANLKVFNKWDIVGIWIKAGVGGNASATMHLIDAERHLIETYDGDDMSLTDVEAACSLQFPSAEAVIRNAAQEQGVSKILVPPPPLYLTMGCCLDVCAYGVLKFTVDPSKTLKKLTHWDGAELEILNKKNALIFDYHVENWDFLHPVEECTMEYTPFEYAEDGEDTGVGAGDPARLDLETYFLTLGEDGGYLGLTPDANGNYPQVTWTTSDSAVVTIGNADEKGVRLDRVGEGVAIVTATLVSDPKITVSCSVYVEGSIHNDWQFLPAAYRIRV